MAAPIELHSACNLTFVGAGKSAVLAAAPHLMRCPCSSTHELDRDEPSNSKRMRFPFLNVLVIACVVSCARPQVHAERALSRGRPCGDVLDYPTDTIVDFQGRQQQLGPRQVSRSGPRYPSQMRNQSVEGSARASFVVDTTGRVPLGTAIITAESDRAFGDAVCTWLAGPARFEPLEVGGRRYAVRMANFPVDFTLTLAR